MGDLDGKTAVITGGTSGIGLGIAEAFVREGARVIVVGRDQTRVDQAVDDLGPSASGIAADVTKVANLDRLFGAVKDRFGGLDILVVSAGSTGGGTLDDCTEEDFDATMALNVKATFFTTQKALPLLRNPSSVILIGSTADTITLPGAGVYSASKAATKAFAQAWGAALGTRGIRVNTLSPGVTDTPLLDRLQSTPQSMAAFDDMMARRTALKRRGRAEELGNAAVFLGSDKSSYTTCGVIYVDGGLHVW